MKGKEKETSEFKWPQKQDHKIRSVFIRMINTHTHTHSLKKLNFIVLTEEGTVELRNAVNLQS